MLPGIVRKMARRGQATAGLGERFGFYSAAVREKLAAGERPVWIHAVSVGEVMLARVLVRELRRLRPEQPVVLTCTTSTGRATALRHLRDEHTVILATPLDAWWVVRRAFRLIRPRVLVLMEQEIWPAQMERAEREGVPVWIVNARLSDRSWRRMRHWCRWVARVVRPVVYVGLQREEDRMRLAQAGFPPHALFWAGSMKCDVAALADSREDLAEQVRRELGWTPDLPVILGGSTHPGEEELLLRCYAQWRARHPQARLFLAPRHAERAAEVMRLAQSAGYRAVRRSYPETGAEVVVLDTTGELRALYALASVVVVGKTWIAPEGRGGQNFLEAAQAGRAIVCGPRVENFRALAEEYATAGAMQKLKSAEELTDAVLYFLDHPAEREAMGARARAHFQAELGVGARVAKELHAALAAEERFPIAPAPGSGVGFARRQPTASGAV